MAHLIMGKRFAARSKPAWHNIAKKIWEKATKITAREAMVEVAGDLEFLKAPMFYELPGEPDGSPLGHGDPKMVRSEKHHAIIRKPTHDSPKHLVLGITSDSWVASSYADLAGSLDKLSETYPVETAGVLKDGGLAFLCFRAPDWNVRGDEMRSYFAANFSLTPGVGHRVFHSPIRVVCWNTNTMAQGQASINLAIPHSSDAMQRIELAGRLVGQFEAMKDKTQAIFDSFADVHITKAEANAIFEAAYPDPNMPPKLKLFKSQLTDIESEAAKSILTPDLLIGLENAQEKFDKDRDLAKELRACAYSRYEVFEPTKLAGTAWAAYNAATEVSDWREGRGADYSSLMGSRAQEKSRAFAETMKIVS